ncbi:MAG: cyclic nucleotide-binding protein, partial [Kiritimatiellae bacterium]|nr:cyclic nucleotide-binding protein [Kiritimatiellia bacterium]
FGEISCLRKEAAIATVKPRSPGMVLRLPREDFDSLIMSHPQILVMVNQLGEERVAITTNALAEKGILI